MDKFCVFVFLASMTLSASFCGLIHRKQVSFVVLLVQLGFVEFSRVSKVRVGIRVSISCSDRVGIGLPDVE